MRVYHVQQDTTVRENINLKSLMCKYLKRSTDLIESDILASLEETRMIINSPESENLPSI